MSILKEMIFDDEARKIAEEALATDCTPEPRPAVIFIPDFSLLVLPYYGRNYYPRFILMDGMPGDPPEETPMPSLFWASRAVGMRTMRPGEIPVAVESFAPVPGCGAFGPAVREEPDAVWPSNSYLIFREDDVPNGGVLFRISATGTLHLWQKVEPGWKYARVENVLSGAGWPRVPKEWSTLCANTLYFSRWLQ